MEIYLKFPYNLLGCAGYLTDSSKDKEPTFLIHRDFINL